MKAGLAAACALTALLAVSAPFTEGAGAARPRAAVSVSPTQLSLRGPAARRIELRNRGAAAVTLEASCSALGARSAASWIVVRPRRLTLGPGARATLTVRMLPPRGASPGDHHALVLLTSRPFGAARVAVRLRVGIVVGERVPGRIVHRLVPTGVRVRRSGAARVVTVALANRGNVVEELPRGRLLVSILRRGRPVARLTRRSRSLLPGARRRLTLAYRGAVRGPAVAVVEIRRGRKVRFAIRL